MFKGIKDYLAAVPPFRRRRLEAIRTEFLSSTPGVKETMKYRMPTFEIEPNWAAIANQKHYISIYYCSAELIDSIKRKHPSLRTGVGCARIRDNQEVPLSDLVTAFRRAMKFKKKADKAL